MTSLIALEEIQTRFSQNEYYSKYDREKNVFAICQKIEELKNNTKKF